jgi:16S rRNA (uracil1498-N3)-methyltransferase
MQNYFIPHKLKVGDCVHLSDKDSEYIISQKLYKVEDPIEILTLEEIFLGVVIDISRASVEVEILKKISDIKLEENDFSISIIQSLSNDIKFNFFLEKAVELGVKKIIPVETEYSLLKEKKALKKLNSWQKILKEAKEQSRNPFDVEITKPLKLKNLNEINSKYKICLATEIQDLISLESCLAKKEPKSSYTIAVGPERGWSFSDLEFLKSLDFEFVKLGNNILRTETASLVVSSILNFKTGKY